LSHVGIGSNPVPAEQAQWKVNQAGPSVSVTPNATQGGLVAGGMQGSRGWDEQPDGATLGGGVGGLPDYMTLPGGQRIPTIMTPFGSRILQAMQMRAEIGLKGTEAAKNQAEAQHTLHIDQSPVFGEAGYNTAKGAEAGAVAQAQLPYDLQKLVTSGQISRSNALAEVQARGGVEAGLQANQQRFTAGQNALGRQQQTTLQQNQQGFERGMVPLRTGATVNAEQQKTLFDNRFSVPGSLMRLLPWTPKEPTAPLPGTVDPAAQQRADWDAAAAHLGAGQDAASVLGPRP
jgi:hypothetical protein